MEMCCCRRAQTQPGLKLLLSSSFQLSRMPTAYPTFYPSPNCSRCPLQENEAKDDKRNAESHAKLLKF